MAAVACKNAWEEIKSNDFQDHYYVIQVTWYVSFSFPVYINIKIAKQHTERKRMEVSTV